MRTIAIINQKGGSGKTTTAINLAAALARLDRRVLLVDVDPQSHCALGLAVPENQTDLTIGDAMLASDSRPPEPDRLIWKFSRNLDLIPSTTRLAALEAPRGGLADRIDRDRRLGLCLTHYADCYDWCLIDCPPFIGLLTFNALRAADEILIPVETGYFALQGALKQVNTIRALGRKVGVLTPFRVLPTLHDPGSPLACDILLELERRFEGSLIPTPIRIDPKLKESASAGVPVIQHDPEATGSDDYTALARFYEAAPRLQAEEVASDHASAPDPLRSTARQERESTEVSPESAPLTLVRGDAPLPRLSGIASRAAELAARARQLAARSQEITQRLDADPRIARVLRELQSEEAPTAGGEAVRTLSGARVTSQGVLFLHEAPPGAAVAIVGDHNDWSPTATPMRFNPATGLHEVVVPILPGRYRYRFVVSPDAAADQPRTENAPGEGASAEGIIVVPARDALSA